MRKLFLFAGLLLCWSVLSAQNTDWGDLLSPRGRVVDLSGRGLFELPLPELQPDVEVLVLDNNDLRSLPADLALRCPYLKALSLRNNAFQAIGPELRGLGQLQELYLDGNQIRQLSGPELQNFRELRVLSLQDNGLIQFEVDFRFLPLLQSLWLDGNELYKLPSLAACRNLVQLSVQNNRVDFIHSDINNCEALEWLDLSGNERLLGLPEELRFCDRLSYIDVSGTGITEVPEWGPQMKALEFFVLRED